MENKILSEFKNSAQHRMDESMRMIQISLMNITEDNLWEKPNDTSNSIGNLLLHLCGNIGQYIISSLGENPDIRERDLEFSTREGFTKDELYQSLSEIVGKAKQVISETGEEKMLKNYSTQGFNLTGIGIVMHVVEHLSYHTGQIAFYVKQIGPEHLGFYRGMDLNAKNEE